MALQQVSKTDFFLRLTNIMSNRNFQDFFNQYFNDWEDVKTSIMFMKTYQFIDNKYQEIHLRSPCNDEMTMLMREMIENRDYRQYMAKNMIKFIEGKYTKNDIDVFFPSALLIKEK